MENPHLGVDGCTWKPLPKVTLQIDGRTGEVVEERIKDGSQQVIIKSFTPPTAKDEQDVLDETNFIKENV